MGKATFIFPPKTIMRQSLESNTLLELSTMIQKVLLKHQAFLVQVLCNVLIVSVFHFRLPREKP